MVGQSGSRHAQLANGSSQSITADLRDRRRVWRPCRRYRTTTMCGCGSSGVTYNSHKRAWLNKLARLERPSFTNGKRERERHRASSDDASCSWNTNMTGNHDRWPKVVGQAGERGSLAPRTNGSWPPHYRRFTGQAACPVPLPVVPHYNDKRLRSTSSVATLASWPGPID